MRSVLVTDDDAVLAHGLARGFRARGIEARVALSCAEAIALAVEQAPDLAVVDLFLPDGHGFELLAALRARGGATTVVMLSGLSSVGAAVDAVHLGAATYLEKPADADAILAALDRGSRLGSGAIAAPAVAPTGPESLARAGWDHIHQTLAACGGNISEAARRLGIHRRSLQRKLRKAPPAR